jgi:hypothetical protein
VALFFGPTIYALVKKKTDDLATVLLFNVLSAIPIIGIFVYFYAWRVAIKGSRFPKISGESWTATSREKINFAEPPEVPVRLRIEEL